MEKCDGLKSVGADAVVFSGGSLSRPARSVGPGAVSVKPQSTPTMGVLYAWGFTEARV